MEKFGRARLEEAGLLISNGGFIFWGAGILIPYWNIGEIIYYQFRLYEPFRGTKYLFLKGIKKQMYLGNITPGNCFVFEGVFDALAFYELTGCENIVAIGGAGGFDQEKIREYIESMAGIKDIQLICCLDDDDAGRKAMDNESCRDEVRFYTSGMACEKLGLSPDNIKDWNEVLCGLRDVKR